MKLAWQEASRKAFPSGHASNFPNYPLLGSELPVQAPTPPPSAWKLRLTLCDQVTSVQLGALVQDVEEVRLRGVAQTLSSQLDGPELYLESAQSTATTAARLVSETEMAAGRLPGYRCVWSREQHQWTEHTVIVDRLLLANLALLRSLPERHPEVDRWLVRSSLSASGEAEDLIGDTLAYWTGAVAGVAVLEVEQQPGESFDTLWARLNIARLLRWEAGLAQPGDALGGAGLFCELSLL